MGEVVEDLQLDDLGVDHDEAQVLRRAAVEQRDDDGVDADGLALAGGAGDQRVRHLGEVLDDGLVRDAVHAEHDGELHRGLGPGLGFDDLAQEHVLAVLVRDLDADGALARDRRQDAHGLGLEVHRDVVREVGDLLHAHARGGLDLVTRDRGALLDADVDAVGGVYRHAVDLELLQGLDEVGGALAEILRRGLGAGGGFVEHADLGEDVVAALLEHLGGAGLLDLVGLDDEDLARLGAEGFRRLAGRLGLGDFLLFFVFIDDGLGLLFLGRLGDRGDRDIFGLHQAGVVGFRTFTGNLRHAGGRLRDRLGGLLGLGRRDGGADHFLLLAAQLGRGDVAAALLLGGREGGGLAFGVPSAEGVAHLGDPRGERGLGVVGQRAEEAEAIREDEEPGAVVAEDGTQRRVDEQLAEDAAGPARVEGHGDVARRAQPEGQDRREEQHAEHHQGHLDRPERVRALVQGEPRGGEEEERLQERGIAEEAEDEDGERGAEGPAGIVGRRDVGGRRQVEGLLEPLREQVLVGGAVEEHRDEQVGGPEREEEGEERPAFAGRAGERGGAFAGGSRHGYSPKRVPCEATSSAAGAGSACRCRGGRVTRAASARARSWARRSTMPARAWRIHFGVKAAAE